MKTRILFSIALSLTAQVLDLKPALAQCILFKWEPGTSLLNPRNYMDLINGPSSEDLQQRDKLKIDVVPKYMLAPAPPRGPDISLEPIECEEPQPEPCFPPFPTCIDLPLSLPEEAEKYKPDNHSAIQVPEKVQDNTIVCPGECETSGSK